MYQNSIFNLFQLGRVLIFKRKKNQNKNLSHYFNYLFRHYLILKYYKYQQWFIFIEEAKTDFMSM